MLKGSVKILHGKGDKSRITYIDDLAFNYLVRYLTENDIICGALFRNKNNNRYTSGGIRYVLKQVEKRANVKGVYPHRFRRTFATTMAARGMSIQEIQLLMGHADINTTLVYVNTSNAQVNTSYRKCTA